MSGCVEWHGTCGRLGVGGGIEWIGHAAGGRYGRGRLMKDYTTTTDWREADRINERERGWWDWLPPTYTTLQYMSVDSGGSRGPRGLWLPPPHLGLEKLVITKMAATNARWLILHVFGPPLSEVCEIMLLVDMSVTFPICVLASATCIANIRPCKHNSWCHCHVVMLWLSLCCAPYHHSVADPGGGPKGPWPPWPVKMDS